MIQQIAWFLTVVLVILIGIIFLIIALKAGRRQDYQPIVEKAYRVRKYYFISLVLVMIVITAISLTNLPYSDHHQEALASSDSEIIVDVKGYQFNWDLSQEEFIVGKPYRFNVTSTDVNHGFGIYDEEMVLLAQTQAMPGYTNPLTITFKTPGTYKILCLEYCSIGHHIMIKDIIVKPDGGVQ